MRKNAKLPKAIGKKIQRIRKSMKPRLTQEELAEKIGVTTTYIGFIEQGRYAPSLKVLEKIAKVLKVNITELFT